MFSYKHCFGLSAKQESTTFPVAKAIIRNLYPIDFIAKVPLSALFSKAGPPLYSVVFI